MALLVFGCSSQLFQMECPDSNGCPHCGDGYRSSNEECDDGNVSSNDGCTANCRVEATETEPNDVVAQANELVQPFYAEISPIGDSDVVEVAVGTQPTVVEALELDSSACVSGALDIRIEMLDPMGTVLASDDDGGEGLCARLEVVGAGGGAAMRYFRVSASSKSLLADREGSFGDVLETPTGLLSLLATCVPRPGPSAMWCGAEAFVP